jgi:hypothetical protein
MQSKEKNGEINQYWRDIKSKKPIEKGEQAADICCKVRITHSSVCTIRDNSDRIKESAKS